MRSSSTAAQHAPLPDDANHSEVERAPASAGDIAPGEARTPNLCLIGASAGALVGILEFVYSAPGAAWAHKASIPVLVAVTASLLGCCGLIYGGMLHLLAAFANSRARFPLKLLALTVAAIGAASRYSGWYAGVLAGSLIAGIAWVAWRRSARGIAVVLLWSILLFVLSPLVNGHAMDRVFTDAETFSIFVGVVCLLPLLARGLLLAAHSADGSSRTTVALAVGVSTLSAALLTACSSVFLIRLWGFNTMQYLEVTLLALKIGCLAIALTAVSTVFQLPVRRSRREVNLFAVLVLLVLFVASAYQGMRRDTTARLLLAQLPDTSFIATRLASVLDRDHDGYSSVFGFGDCDDSDPKVSPGGIDWPGDGVDENCFGGDLKSAAHSYFSLPIEVAPPSPPLAPRRKIVVFVLLDTLRADAVDYAGGATPEIAAIARRSLTFERAYAQSNNTLESLPFLFHMGFRDFPRFHRPWTLVNQFQAGGVGSVGVFQSGPRFWLDERDDVFTGFERKLYPDPHVGYRTSQETAALAAAELTRQTDERPLFLYVHFEALHDSFTQVMEGDRIRFQGVNLSEFARLWNIDKMVALMKERYVAALTNVDQALAVLWDGIQRAEDNADVLFILTSDHGEEFHDHGGLFHMGTLHEELVRVPLIMYRTGATPRVEAMPVGLYRVPGTILQWLGYSGQFLDEMDLFREPPQPYEIFGYFAFGGEWERRTFMILEDGYKLIYDTGRGRLELYDVTDDPREQRNLAGAPESQAVQQRLVDKMDTTMFYMNYGDIEFMRRMRERGASPPQAQSAPAEG